MTQKKIKKLLTVVFITIILIGCTSAVPTTSTSPSSTPQTSIAVDTSTPQNPEQDETAVPSADTSQLQTAIDLYEQGNALLDDGDIEGAIELYEQAIDLDPEYARAFYGLGNALYDSGNFENAINNYTEAIRLEPQFSTAYHNRALALSEEDDLSRAIEDFTEAIRLEPEDSKAYYNRGVAFFKNSNLDRAIQDYTEAIRLDPEYAEAYVSRGEALADKDNPDGAIEDFTEALRLEPQNERTYYSRGLTLSRMGDFRAAIRDYTEAIRLDPQFAAAYNGRGNALYQIGDSVGAIEDYTEAIYLNPQFAGVYENRAFALLETGDSEGALDDFIEVVRLEPENAQAHYNLGTAYGFLSEPESAIESLTEAIRLNPQFAAAYSDRSGHLYNIGNVEDAFSDVNEAIRLDPTFLGAYLNRGLLYAGTDDLDASAADFRVFLEILEETGQVDVRQPLVESWLESLEAGDNPFDLSTGSTSEQEETVTATAEPAQVVEGFDEEGMTWCMTQLYASKENSQSTNEYRVFVTHPAGFTYKDVVIQMVIDESFLRDVTDFQRLCYPTARALLNVVRDLETSGRFRGFNLNHAIDPVADAEIWLAYGPDSSVNMGDVTAILVNQPVIIEKLDNAFAEASSPISITFEADEETLKRIIQLTGVSWWRPMDRRMWCDTLLTKDGDNEIAAVVSHDQEATIEEIVALAQADPEAAGDYTTYVTECWEGSNRAGRIRGYMTKNKELIVATGEARFYKDIERVRQALETLQREDPVATAPEGVVAGYWFGSNFSSDEEQPIP